LHGIPAALISSVNTSRLAETLRSSEISILVIRRRLYGLCIVVALAVTIMVQLSEEKLPLVQVYLPVLAAAMVAVGLAGAEWQVYLQKAAADRLARVAEQDDALDRQRAFNELWQALADSRGQAVLPESVMEKLANLFATEFVAVWSADESPGGFRLRGAQPVDEAVVRRLDKIVQASPCFGRLRKFKRTTQVTDLARETSPALALFCEEKNLTQAVLCPVMVRQEMVGVLAFFYPQDQPVPSPRLEEMQSAANLLLCAL